MIDDTAYFISKTKQLIRVNLGLLSELVLANALASDSEEVVCDDVRRICSDGRLLLVLTRTDSLFDVDHPSSVIRLDE